jgi:natural product biosynthesis luciferase-like monooxygenase protein
MFFTSEATERGADKYQLVVDSARLADRLGFAALWIPERHFHPFGGLFPNPSVLASALAMVTQRIRLRAGSVVLPLHDPLRVVEEWSVVDNLSGGRVDLGLAAGRNARDFVLAPQAYEPRAARTLDGLALLRRLWRGEAIAGVDGLGRSAEVRTYPRPLQQEPGLWLTASGAEDTFISAGALGVNVLTALMQQSTEELAENVAGYRAARAEHGHDVASGRVTVMVHTYLDEDIQRVRDMVREPFGAYLRSFLGLWGGQDERSRFVALSERQQRDAVEFAFERYFQRSAMFGTPARARDLAAQLAAIGVDEIACLVDFGVDAPSVLASLERLARVKDQLALAPAAAAP